MISLRLTAHEVAHGIAALRCGAELSVIKIIGRGHCRTFPVWPDGAEPTLWQQLRVTMAGELVQIEDATQDAADVAEYDQELQERARRWVTFVVKPELDRIPLGELEAMRLTLIADGALLIERDTLH